MTAEESSLQEVTAYRAVCGQCEYEMPWLRISLRGAVWEARNDRWEYQDGEWICAECAAKERGLRNERPTTENADSADQGPF